jgi:hypothetical protein
MATYSTPMIKTLFARSGNRCAFPDCPELLVRDDGHIAAQICHIKASKPGGPRFDPEQSSEERNGASNLILLCANHHAVVDAQPHAYTVEVLEEMKVLAEKTFGRAERNSDLIFARALIGASGSVSVIADKSNVAINSPGAIQAQTIVLKQSRKATSIVAPPGTIGADGDALAYVKRLIDRYNEFAMREPSRGQKFSHGAIYSVIRSKFGCHWNLIPMRKFEELCAYLEGRIAKTRVAKSSAAKGRATTSSFEDFVVKYRK